MAGSSRVASACLLASTTAFTFFFYYSVRVRACSSPVFSLKIVKSGISLTIMLNIIVTAFLPNPILKSIKFRICLCIPKLHKNSELKIGHKKRQANIAPLNQLPLLHSCPGGVKGSWSYQTADVKVGNL